MIFKKIEEVQDVYPESLEGTDEWYFSKIAKDIFCDLYEAEDIVKKTGNYEGMNCILIHFPDGKAYRLFEEKKNQYVESPVYLDGMIYFLVVNFDDKQMEIISWNPQTEMKNTLTKISLDEVEDCYNLRLIVSPLTLVRQGSEREVQVIWPEKAVLEERSNEALVLRDNNDFYFSRWSENPIYQEEVVIRDIKTGYIKEKFRGQLMRMPNGEVWIL